MSDPILLKYFYCFDVLGLNLLSIPLLLSLPDLRSGICPLYKNWRLSTPKRLPQLSCNKLFKANYSLKTFYRLNPIRPIS